MKSAPVFFLGLLVAVAASWAGIVLGSHLQLSSLAPFFDEATGKSYPQRTSGLAARGQLVYADLGCAACHTQQVRRPDFGSDKARGWGERQSVARDYIYQARPQLGSSRLGPDLANYGARVANNPEATQAIYQLLYAGSANHPSYPFLFADEEIIGERSLHALPHSGAAAPAAGRQVVATERARTLAAYLLSLNQDYSYPESIPVEPPAKKPEPSGPPPAKVPVTPIPAAAPDEKK